MSFISLESLLFVFITIVVNTALPIRFRQAWLLVCSLAFISLLSLPSALVIAGLSTLNFALGKRVTYSKNAFYFGIILNLSAIISTNYFSYSAQNLSLNIKPGRILNVMGASG